MVVARAQRKALADPDVEAVLAVDRRPRGVAHPRLREPLLPDLLELDADEPRPFGWHAPIRALGVRAAGFDEAAYARTTGELTLLWAGTLLRLNPGFSFRYCPGAGASAARCSSS